jgi:histidinol dehydrogenase
MATHIFFAKKQNKMLKFYKYPSQKEWPEICMRPVFDSISLYPAVQSIIDEVKQKGDIALKNFSNKFDGVKLNDLAVPPAEIIEAGNTIPQELKKALRQAKINIEKFHKEQKAKSKKIKISNGITCWRESRAIDKVGLYIPGGSAPLFSTVLMLAIPANLAGCKEIILCTPPDKEGKINSAILYAASLCKVTKIYKTGGAQAIAAMAYGTETIPAVNKIFGPGNQYVTAAKQLVQGKVAIDMPAGPSEVLVIADDTAVPSFVASDLLAQAEHGPDSQVILITTNSKIANAVVKEVDRQMKLLPRKDIVQKSLQHSKIIIIKTLQQAIEISNLYAPEHLILACKTNKKLLASIRNAGSVFVGNYSPESAGDYASGTNHTLPTNGYASMYSGVSLDSFYKKITFQQLSKQGVKGLAQTITTMAEAEGLQAHSNSVKIRI